MAKRELTNVQVPTASVSDLVTQIRQHWLDAAGPGLAPSRHGVMRRALLLGLAELARDPSRLRDAPPIHPEA